MSRSRWFMLGSCSWAGVLALVAVACGDSVTGGETPEPVTADGGPGGNDAAADQSATVPPKDASVPDTNKPDTAAVDGGAPNVTETTLDFGEVDCGKNALQKTFTIQNPSAAAIAWTAALGKGAASTFTIAPESGNLAAGDSVIVTVTPKAVPSTSSTAANALGDVVNLSLGTTNATVSLKETARGAILYYSPASLPFGNTPTAAGPVETQFAIANSGNATANATLTTSGDAAFTIVGSTSLSAVPGLTGSKVRFTPTANQAYAGAVALTVGANDPLCAPLPPNMTLTGTGTDGILAVTPPSISFGNNGLVDCGTTAAAQKVKITNSGNAPVNYTAVLARGTAVFTVAPAGGQVAANSFVEVTVTPKVIPTSTPTTPDLFNDTLTVTTDAVGDSPHAITLRETARGAILSRPQGGINFGNVAVGTTASQQFSFANTGNVSITVNLANAFAEFVQTSPVTVSEGGFAAPLLSFTPALKQPYTDVGTVTMVGTVPLCGGFPGNMTLQGTGVAPSITAPSPLNFGFVPCGTTATPKTVRITNNGPATTFDALLIKGAGSPFTIAPTSGPMAAGGFVDITVTPKPIPAPPIVSTTSTNGFNDVLEVSSGNTPGVPLNITINETAQGAVITYNKTNHGFGNVKSNSATSSTTVTVTNAGNLTADLTFATTSSAGDVFSTNPTSATIANGTNTSPGVTFTPVANTPYTGTWSASTMTILCAPLPAAVTLTGTGVP